jgi:hypothetical protein
MAGVYLMVFITVREGRIRKSDDAFSSIAAALAARTAARADAVPVRPVRQSLRRRRVRCVPRSLCGSATGTLQAVCESIA